MGRQEREKVKADSGGRKREMWVMISGGSLLNGDNLSASGRGVGGEGGEEAGGEADADTGSLVCEGRDCLPKR